MTPTEFEQWLLLLPVATMVILFTLNLVKTWFRDQGMFDDPRPPRREARKGDDESDGA